jgi:hypothetical protein
MSSLSDWYNAPAASRNTNGTVSTPSSSSSSGSGGSRKSTPAPVAPVQTPQSNYIIGGGYTPPSPSYSGGSVPYVIGGGITATPAPSNSGGYMNIPTSGGGSSGGNQPPMPYKVGDVTYTPPPANWNGMSQAQRDAYGQSIGSGASAGGSGGIGAPVAASANGKGVGVGSFEGGQFGYPAMPGQTTPGQTAAPATPFPVKTPAEIAAEAKARTDALLAKQTTIAGQTKQGFQTSFDRLAATTKDDRTLQDAAFQRNTNPFSGSTGFQKDMTGRQREISDQQSKQDLQTRLANVDLTLADYANANEAERMKMETDMTNAERAYGMQVDQMALQRQGQANSQFNADRQYGMSQSQLSLQQQAQQNAQSNADRSFNQSTSQNQFNNSLATNQQNAALQNQKFNQTQKTKQDHIDLANLLSQQYGVPVNPTDDPMESYAQVAGLSTVAAKKLAQDAQNTTFDNAIKLALANNTIDKTQADTMQQAQQLAISRQNANTSASSAANSATNAANSNALAQQRLALDKSKAGEGNLAQLTDSLNHTFGTFDSYSGKFQGIEPSKLPQLRQSIIDMNLPDYQTDQILASYGIPTK